MLKFIFHPLVFIINSDRTCRTVAFKIIVIIKDIEFLMRNIVHVKLFTGLEIKLSEFSRI